MEEQLKINEIYVRLQYLKGRKVIDIVRKYEGRIVSFHKEKPVEGRSTSSIVIQTKDDIVINP